MGAMVEKEQSGTALASANGDLGPDLNANGRSAPLSSIEPERNSIFDSLVKVEGEVSGLIAYSIYKQNKRAWLNDFSKTVGRPPTEAETRAYIIGESTERRLATYRHLAQAALAGQGPDAGARAGRSVSFYVVSAIIIVVAAVALAFALRSGIALPK